MNAEPTLAVLHVALNPYTGAWSVMRELALAQARSGRYAGVGIGVIVDRRWPAAYREELRAAGLPAFTAATPALFGTASFVYQALRRPGIERWVSALRAQTGARYVLVHCHNAWMSGVFFPLRDGGNDTRCVATFHGVNAELEGQPVRHALHRWMARRLVRSGALLTSVDAENPERAEWLLGIPADRFRIVGNGVPATTLRGCPYARGADTFTVGHVGSITARKGWSIALEAVRRLAAQGRRIRLVVAGTGTDADAAAAAAQRDPDLVAYRGHVQAPRDRLMPELDLLSVMSVREGLPMTIIEAMSVGVPVAATAVGGIPHAVRAHESGFLVERTPEALVTAVQPLLDSPAALAALSRRTVERFLAHFEIGRIVDAYDALYRVNNPAAPESRPA